MSKKKKTIVASLSDSKICHCRLKFRDNNIVSLLYPSHTQVVA